MNKPPYIIRHPYTAKLAEFTNFTDAVTTAFFLAGSHSLPMHVHRQPHAECKIETLFSYSPATFFQDEWVFYNHPLIHPHSIADELMETIIDETPNDAPNTDDHPLESLRSLLYALNTPP